MGLVSRCNNASTWEAALRAGKSGPFCRCLLRSNGLHHFAGALCALAQRPSHAFSEDLDHRLDHSHCKGAVRAHPGNLRCSTIASAARTALVIVNLVFEIGVPTAEAPAEGWHTFGRLRGGAAVFYVESRPAVGTPHIGWLTSSVVAIANLAAGWLLWRSSQRPMAMAPD